MKISRKEGDAVVASYALAKSDKTLLLLSFNDKTLTLRGLVQFPRLRHVLI